MSEAPQARRMLAAGKSANDIVLFGDSDSLSWLGKLLQTSEPLEQALVLTAPIAPYEPLRHLRASVGVGAVVIASEHQTITIKGGVEGLAILGGNLCWFVDNQRPEDAGAHIHLEHMDAPGYPIAKSSVPLVVSFLR